MAIAYDASASQFRFFSGGTTMDGTLSITTASNALIAVAICAAGSGGVNPDFTVTDGTNTYTRQSYKEYNTGNAYEAAIFLAENVGSGAKSITITSNNNCAGRTYCASFTGLGAYSAANDPPVQTTGNSTTPATGSSATLSQANMLILTLFGGGVLNSATVPPTTGYTTLYSNLADTNPDIIFAYKIVAATTAVSAAVGTTSSADHWAALLCMVPESGGAAGHPTQRRFQGIPRARLGGQTFGRGF